MATILPVILFVVVATLLTIALLLPPKLLAPRRKTAVKQMPYESGMDPIHDARRRFETLCGSSLAGGTPADGTARSGVWCDASEASDHGHPP